MFSMLKRLLASALFSSVAVLAHAENLVTIKSETLPPFAGAPTAMFVALDQTILVEQQRLWKLDEGRKGWSALPWAPAGTIVGSIANGRRPYLLIASQANQGIDRIEIYPDASAPPGSQAEIVLPRLPGALTETRGAVLDGTLYLVGVAADGQAQWQSINLKSAQPT